MGTNADTWKYQELVGNAKLVVVVDIGAFRVVSSVARFEVRFNRILGSGTQEIVRLEPGDKSLPRFVAGSVKFGIDLLRPQWSWIISGGEKNLVNVACGGYVRQQSFLLTDAIWHKECVITWRRSSMAVADRLILTPPFIPESYRSSKSGNLC